MLKCRHMLHNDQIHRKKLRILGVLILSDACRHQQITNDQ